NLAFITSGGSCAPLWGGVTDLGSDKVAAQIGARRAKGGDVRVSCGGAAGHELALNGATAADLAKAYGKVVDQGLDGEHRDAVLGDGERARRVHGAAAGDR
ncbi:hypothetical protein R6G00_15765, partial [Streptomyces roseofulvus]|nr:hypothetical protein [Streptomyces roseolus]